MRPIGWKEMEKAIIAAQHAGLPLKFDVEFRPFRLDNTLPSGYPIDKVCCLSALTPGRSSAYPKNFWFGIMRAPVP